MTAHSIRVVKEEPWHFEAFQFWATQNFPIYDVVAKKFNRGRSTIQKIACWYKWSQKRDELMKAQDKLFVGDLNLTVGEIRREAIRANRIIREWINCLARKHQELIEQERDATEKEKAYMRRLRTAIDDFDPKSMRELTADLKDNVIFYPEKAPGRFSDGSLLPPGESQLPAGEGGVKVLGPCLVLTGLHDKEEVKKLISQGPKPLGDASQQPV